jgi:hypothetical protein
LGWYANEGLKRKMISGEYHLSGDAVLIKKNADVRSYCTGWNVTEHRWLKKARRNHSGIDSQCRYHLLSNLPFHRIMDTIYTAITYTSNDVNCAVLDCKCACFCTGFECTHVQVHTATHPLDAGIAKNTWKCQPI